MELRKQEMRIFKLIQKNFFILLKYQILVPDLQRRRENKPLNFWSQTVQSTEESKVLYQIDTLKLFFFVLPVF